ncbi:MAG: biotin--[acetyl-CoA-carboxylase] ligase [Candidatus Margulisbacteria bacterium]|nr:biotin--[acetyl-CoA-carboxylase] ligase [Candidatus Margulisiibacteriota bacterium]
MIIGKKIIHYSEIDSTNDEAKRLISKGAGEGTVIIADAQSKGRGKPGFGWFSPPGVGLYLSAIVKPYKNPKELVLITAIGASSVVSLISQLCGLEAKIKLPNDVILNNKKICGVLVERVVTGQLIIGIGFNVNNQPGSFPEDIINTATSLRIATNNEYDLQLVRDKLLNELDREYLAYLTEI